MSRIVTITLPAVTLLILALGTGLTVAADPGAMPPPGKLDTFAQDTWLRRNKYPLQIKLSEAEGKGGQHVPIILSVACGEGDYPAGKLCPVLAGQRLAAQVDVLATWPSDKSVKHALVSLVVPKIGPRQILEFSFTQAAPALPAKFVPAVDLKAMSFRAEFDNPDGKKTVAAIDAGTLGRMADILTGKITGAEAKKLAPRMCGPVCYEFEVQVPAKTGEANDKEIDVFYRLRLFSGVKGVRVEYDVENTRIPGKPYKKPFPAVDRAFTKVLFQAGPVSKPETVDEQGETSHWYATRYRICKWWGERPLEPFAKESAPYLMFSQFFPKLDLDHPMTDQELARAIESMKASRGAKKNVKWYREPAEFPDGSPLSNGPMDAWMGDYGGRPEIGFYPLWALLALVSDSPEMLHHARLWEGNAPAAFPIHVRQAETGLPGTTERSIRGAVYQIGNHPDSVTHTFAFARVGKGCPNSPDCGHVPDAAYYTYLATGEKFYEEEMTFWAMAMFWGEFIQGHDRYNAWPLRNATDAAFVLPDGNPLKAYLANVVQKSVNYQRDLIKKDVLAYWAAGRNRRCVSAPDFVCSRVLSPWQECFNIWVLDNCSRKGFPSAAVAREAVADLFYRMFEGKEEFKAPNGKVYRWENPGCIVPYHMAIDLVRLDFTDAKHVKETFITGIADNTGAMWYYTLVNLQNQYKGDEKLAAKLPKKVMEPEDWPLDPEFEKKTLRNVSQYMLSGENGPTFAALARYDNPRALAIHDYLCAQRDKLMNPNKRMRAIEAAR